MPPQRPAIRALTELSCHHHMSSMPPAPPGRGCGRVWGLTVGLAHPKVGNGVGGHCPQRCQWPRGGALLGSHGSRSSSVSPPCREGSSLGWNICSMRSWFAETARSPRRPRGGDASRGHRGEVAAGDGPGAPPPRFVRGQAGLCSLGDPSAGLEVVLSPVWDVSLGVSGCSLPPWVPRCPWGL